MSIQEALAAFSARHSTSPPASFLSSVTERPALQNKIQKGSVIIMELVLLTALGVGGATVFGSVIGFAFKKYPTNSQI